MSKTAEEIHAEMLDVISDDYDKQEGSFIYDATKPAAIELEKLYQEKEKMEAKLSIENLFGDELEQAVNERTGITRRPATKATTVVIVSGEIGATINVGDKVSTDSVLFSFVESKTIGSSGQVEVLVECDEPGPIGNVPAHTIINFPVTIQGLTGVTNPEPVINGYDAETDESLLERYYERIRTPATSANKAHYRNWAKEVPGVGDVKVFPKWNGDNTVKVLIIDSNKQPAPSSLVDDVQNYIDPGSTGLDEGQAPIGAFCTVASASALTINVSFTALKDPAFTDEQRQESVEANITAYLNSIAFNSSQVSFAQIGYAILESDGIADYTDLTINDGTANILIGDEEVPVLGVVTID